MEILDLSSMATMFFGSGILIGGVFGFVGYMLNGSFKLMNLFK